MRLKSIQNGNLYGIINLENILQLHSNVAREIAEQVDLTLTGPGEKEFENAKPVDPEVYELYLRGLQLAHMWAINDLTTCIDLLQQAIEMDSTRASSKSRGSNRLEISVLKTGAQKL